MSKKIEEKQRRFMGFESGQDETLQDELSELRQENSQRYEYVLSRAVFRDSVAEALKDAGLTEYWYYTARSDEDRKRLEGLATRLYHSDVLTSNLILRKAAPKAARKKVAGLKSRNEYVAQAAASDILDRTIGKKAERQEVDMTIKVPEFEQLIRKLYGPKEQ